MDRLRANKAQVKVMFRHNTLLRIKRVDASSQQVNLDQIACHFLGRNHFRSQAINYAETLVRLADDRYLGSVFINKIKVANLLRFNLEKGCTGGQIERMQE